VIIAQIGPLYISYTAYNLYPGFMVETVSFKNVHFTAWDLGGRCPLVSFWLTSKVFKNAEKFPVSHY